MTPPAWHEEAATACLRAALSRPAVAAADVWIKESRHRRTRWTEEGTQTAAAGESGLALRVFHADGRVGHAFTGEPADPEAIAAVATGACRLAERCSPGCAPLPPGTWKPRDLDLHDPAVQAPASPTSLLERLRAAVAEEAAGEVRVESLLCVTGTSWTTMATSGRFLASFPSSLVTIVLGLHAARGGNGSFDRSVIASRHLGSLDIARIGRAAARRVRLPLAGDRPPPGPVRVALGPRAACLLLEHLAPSLVDGAAARGRSALPGDVGAPVGPSGLSIVDDASLPGGLGSAPFDGEGRPTEACLLVDRGRLAPLLGSPRRREGDRVGAAQRPSYADPPIRIPSNLHVARGERGARAILADAGRVLRLTGATLLGRGGPASGEVALAGSGEWLEAGEPSGGVAGVTLVGSLGELLAGVLEVGNDLRFHLRGITVGSPTILLDGFSIV